MVAIAARNARAWLEDPEVVADPERLPPIEETLTAQTRRLDGLEGLLLARGINTQPR